MQITKKELLWLFGYTEEKYNERMADMKEQADWNPMEASGGNYDAYRHGVEDGEFWAVQKAVMNWEALDA